MYQYKCKIIKVVDGDTVDVDIDLGFDMWLRKQRIRLYGIDTPESRTRDKAEKKYGLLAKKFVQDNLKLDSTYMLNTKEKGKYGRYLGDLTCESSKSICDLLVKKYHAVPYFGQSKKEIKQAHLENRKALEALEG